MRFNPKARLDTARVRDTGRRGAASRGALSRTGGLGRAGSGISPTALRGGGLGTLVAVAVVIGFLLLSGGGPGSGAAVDDSRMSDTDRYASCETGADAQDSPDCARVAVENSLVDYWSGELGDRARPERALVTFTGSTDSGCGPAGADVGPFYCPVDETIYLDTTFFDTVLERRLGGPDGGFVEPYVLAHEYGHHVQNLLGTMSRVRTQQGPTSDAVRLELQADCYAGMWAGAATTTTDAGGEALLTELTRTDVQQALAAAQAVGDDEIQARTQGQVTEETFTHGSAAQRMDWFTTGYEQGSLEDCDTFAADAL